MKLLITALIGVLLISCQQQSKPAEVIVVSKYTKTEKSGGINISGVEFFGYKHWVEGTIKNIGDLPAKEIKIVFKASAAGDPIVEDNISYLAPGESISFRTSSFPGMDNYAPSVDLKSIIFK